jgi:hypothetical protein
MDIDPDKGKPFARRVRKAPDLANEVAELPKGRWNREEADTMKTILFAGVGVFVLSGLVVSEAAAESTGFMYLSPDQSYCRGYEIDSEGNLLSFFRANDTTVNVTAMPNGMVTATCIAKAQGKNLVRKESETTFSLDMCSIRQEEAGFETTMVVGNGQVTISELGEISMTCHGVPAASK